jgi:cytochrome b
MPPGPEPQRIRVWDLPTRLFHWLLALCIVGSVATAKIGGNAMVWHTRLGLAVLALLVFRIVWGFVGGYWSRFVTFLYSPASLRDYLRGSSGPSGRFDIGHSPLGALSVFALLGLLALQVATGLVADDEVATTGPLNRFVSSAWAGRASDWHEHWGQWMVYLAVATHVAAVLYYLRFRNQNLIRPMLDGDKEVLAGTSASRDDWSRRLLGLAIAALAAASAWWVGSLGA